MCVWHFNAQCPHAELATNLHAGNLLMESSSFSCTRHEHGFILYRLSLSDMGRIPV